MNSKKLIAMILLLLLLLATSVQVFAEGSVTAEIPFTVKNAPGTVVMEAVDNAPSPKTATFTNVFEGKFEITYTEPGDYYYTIRQIPGEESEITYDDTEYTVVVSVYTENDRLSTPVVTVSKAGSAEKPDNVEFDNTIGTTTLEIIKVAKKDGKPIFNVRAFDEITYEITVTNTGDVAAINVEIVDTLPVEKPLLSIGTIENGGVLSEDEKTVTWTIPKILKGQSEIVSFTVIVPPIAGKVLWRNVVSVQLDNPISTSSGSWRFSQAIIQQDADVNIDKMQAKNDEERTKERIYVIPGDRITYFINVTNNSNGTVHNMTITDKIPDGLELVPNSIDNGGIENNGVITWNLGEFAEGRVQTVSFQCRVPDVNQETIWINGAEGSFLDDLYEPESLFQKIAALFSSERALRTNEVEAIYTPTESSEPTEPSKPANPEEPGATPGASGSPETGDSGHLAVGLIVMITSLLSCIMLVIFEKKKKLGKKAS